MLELSQRYFYPEINRISIEEVLFSNQNTININ
jgi:hypothetical protein